MRFHIKHMKCQNEKANRRSMTLIIANINSHRTKTEIYEPVICYVLTIKACHFSPRENNASLDLGNWESFFEYMVIILVGHNHIQ